LVSGNRFGHDTNLPWLPGIWLCRFNDDHDILPRQIEEMDQPLGRAKPESWPRVPMF